MTIKEMIEVAQPDPMLLQHCHVEIDGVPLDPAKIHLIRPKAGHLVTVRVAPGKSKKKEGGGGGKNPLQTVLQIAIIAAGIALIVAAPHLSPLDSGRPRRRARRSQRRGRAWPSRPRRAGGNLRR